MVKYNIAIPRTEIGMVMAKCCAAQLSTAQSSKAKINVRNELMQGIDCACPFVMRLDRINIYRWLNGIFEFLLHPAGQVVVVNK